MSRPTSADIDHAVDVLRDGGLVAFPTETVYGLGADASNAGAVERIFTAKGRPTGHPLIVHIASPADLPVWALDIAPMTSRLVDRCWPGPLTVVLRRSEQAADAVTGGRDTIGVRIPDHDVALELLRRSGMGLAAPSANRFGRVSPTTASDVRAELGGAVDFVLDGGSCTVGVESTIVDLSGTRPLLLRPGGVAVERIEELLGEKLAHDRGPARAPGMLASHYAPRTRTELVDADALLERIAELRDVGDRVAVLAPAGEQLPAGVVEIARPSSTEEYARVLYRSLRAGDDHRVDVLVVVAPESIGMGRAVADRLGRAAHRDSD